MNIWGLPGPSRFLSDIAEDLNKGKNVLIFYPYEDDFDIGYNLKQYSKELNSWIDLSDCLHDMNVLPLDYIFEKYIQNNYNTLRDVQSLIEANDDLRTFWLDLSTLESEVADKWIHFISDYSRLCHSKHPLYRFVFCFLIRKPGNFNFVTESALSHHHFFSCIDKIDFHLLIYNYSAAEKLSSEIEKHLAEELLFELSFPDIQLLNYLNSRIEDLVLSPIDIIEEYFEDKKIDPVIVDKFIASYSETKSYNFKIDAQHPFFNIWMTGLLGYSNNRFVISSLACVSNKHWGIYLNEKVWRSHIKYLFPLVEKTRIKIIKYIKKKLGYKLKELFNKVDDRNYDKLDIYSDVEVSTLWRMMDKMSTGVIREASIISTMLYSMKNIRNDIAHLSPAKYNDIVTFQEMLEKINLDEID